MIKCITKIELNQHLVSVLFTLLDQDGDGMLSRKEFVRVIKAGLLEASTNRET